MDRADRRGLDFLFLRFNFPTQYLVVRSERFHGTVVFIKLRLHDLHLGAKDFERLVDLGNGFLNSFRPPDQFSSQNHLSLIPPPPSDSLRDNVINEQFPLGLCQPVILFVTFPQVEQ